MSVARHEPEGGGEDFALGVATPNSNHLLYHRFEVLHSARIVAVPKGGNRLNHGEHHLHRWHVALRQALAELWAQPGKSLSVICRGIGEGAVGVRKRCSCPFSLIRGFLEPPRIDRFIVNHHFEPIIRP